MQTCLAVRRLSCFSCWQASHVSPRALPTLPELHCACHCVCKCVVLRSGLCTPPHPAPLSRTLPRNPFPAAICRAAKELLLSRRLSCTEQHIAGLYLASFLILMHAPVSSHILPIPAGACRWFAHARPCQLSDAHACSRIRPTRPQKKDRTGLRVLGCL